ncbi:MAG: response regulator [Desulfomonilia bacterium]|jgi:two-component system NtrC family sensor kinase
MDEQVRILCVDDEISILKTLKRLFMDTEYEILTASSSGEGLDLLSSTQPIQVVVSDYRMPGINGVEFLQEVCRRWPHTIRIVLSGYADTASIVSAINEGQIYKFIPKPWNDDELKITIANAVERYFLRRKNIELTNKLKDTNEELRIINENLERMVDERTQELLFRNQALISSQNIFDALPVAVVGLTPDGMIALYNKMGASLFGETILGAERLTAFSPEINIFIDRVIAEGHLTEKIIFSGRTMRTKGMVMNHKETQQGIVLVFDEE